MSDKVKKVKKENNDSIFKWFLQVLTLALVFLGIYMLVFKFVLSNETVSGDSMQPTFENRDRIIAVRHSKIERGDVVILDAPDNPGVLYIKRVIGMPGDTIKSVNDTLYINDKPYKEPYLNEYKKKTPKGELFTGNFDLLEVAGQQVVPFNTYFVMGDNRKVSKDSRRFGFVKEEAIQGEVKLRYFPLDQIKFF